MRRRDFIAGSAALAAYAQVREAEALVGSRRALLGGVGNQWQAGFTKLKAAAALAKAGSFSPNHANVMASPPTITTSTSISLLSGLTSVQAKWPSTNLGNLNLFSGQSADVGGTYRLVNSDTVGPGSVGNTTAWRIEGMFNAAKIGLQLNGDGYAGNYRFLVNDVYVSLTGTVPAASSGASYMLLDFTSVGAKASRKAAIECQGSQLWAGFFVASGDTISQPTGIPVRGMFVGDSFIESSTGASIDGDGFWMIAADGLGARNAWGSGVGGTGWVNNATTKYNLGQRISDVTTSAADFVVVEMGLNDKGLSSSAITAAVTSDLAAIRVALPLAPIFVIPGWDVDAPSAAGSSFVAMVAAVKAGMVWGTNGQRGMWCLDPTGVSYTKIVDNTHPDPAGHATLGAWVVAQVQAILGV